MTRAHAGESSDQSAVIVGGGGHGRVVAESAMLLGWSLVGFVDDDPDKSDVTLADIRVLGPLSILPDLLADGIGEALIGIGGTGDNTTRRRIFQHVTRLGFRVPAVVHPMASVSRFASIGHGSFAAAGCVIGVSAVIGMNTICNTGSLIDHDCLIGDHVHIAPGATLSGSVEIGAESHIGTNATVIEGIRVGSGALVAAGAVVVEDVPDLARVAGVPARPLHSTH